MFKFLVVRGITAFRVIFQFLSQFFCFSAIHDSNVTEKCHMKCNSLMLVVVSCRLILNFELLTQYIGINLYQKGFSVLKRAVAGVMTVTLTEGPHHQL